MKSLGLGNIDSSWNFHLGSFITNLRAGSEFLPGLGLLGKLPFEDKVYKLGSSIDRAGCCVCCLEIGGGGADDGGEGARCDEIEGGPFGGGWGGGAAGDACPAARIAACIARL
jgi:hypothetical protein